MAAVTDYLRLFWSGPEQLLAFFAPLAVFVLLACLGASVARREWLTGSEPLIGWALVSAVLTTAGGLFHLPLVLPAWGALVACFGAAVVLFRREQRRPSPLVLKGLVLLLPLLVLASARSASEWDEFSHWAGAIRYLVEHHVLPDPTRPPTSAQFPGYPFAYPMLGYLAGLLAGRFLEAAGGVFNVLFLFAYGLLAVRLAWAGAGRDDAPPAGWGAAALAVLAGTALNPTFVQKVVLTSYADVTTAVAAAIAGVLGWRLVGALAEDRPDAARALAWQFGLVAMVLINIKQVNLVLLVSILTGIALAAWRDPAVRLAALFRLLPLMVLPAGAIYLVWRYHVGAHVGGSGEAKLMPPSEWLFGLIPEVLARMASIASKKGVYFGIMLAAVALAVKALFRFRGAFDRLALVVGCAFLGYNAFLLLAYIASMGKFDALRAASYWRYNMHLGLLAAAFAAFAAGALWRRFLGERPWPKAASALAVALVLALPFAFAPKLRFDLEPPKPHFRAVAAAVAALVPKTARLLVLDPGGSGESGVITAYHLDASGGRVSFISAFSGLTEKQFAQSVGASAPDYLLVHSVLPFMLRVLGLPIEPRVSYLLRRADGGRWILVRAWPYPPVPRS